MNGTALHDDAPSRRALAVAVALCVALLVGAGVLLFGGDDDTSVATIDTAPDPAPDTARDSTADTAPGGAELPSVTSPVFVNAVSSTVPPPITAAPTPSTTVAPAPTSTVPAPTTEPPAPTTTAAPVVTETLPEQPPAPIRPPSDPRAEEEEIQLGAIRIPKLGVDAPLLEGIRLTTLDDGPGHWPGTAMPGEVGNVVVAGHRTSHGGPFRHIDQLVAGDIVQFETADGVVDYTVTKTFVVEPDAVWIVDPTDTPTATLFACHPPGSVRQRIVVSLSLDE